MLDPTRGALRLTRAAVLGATGFALTLVAHVVAGGSVPATGALVLLGLCTALLCIALTGRRLGRSGICGVLALTEGSLHAAFMWLSQPMGALSHLAVVPGHHTAETALGVAQPGMTTGMHMLSATPGVPGWVMLAAHTVVSLVMALLLSHGERVLWFVAGLARPFQHTHALPQLSAPHRFPALVTAPEPKLPFLGGSGLGLRGPPMRRLPLLSS